ncbi:DUF4145 domain-containing protein [Serratia ureilytica]|uniref:DUF4145 domain-containing protein n=1 Tax=Serratia ureilytica TaxID=300181 RepID=UPI0018D8430C|nr:DUF4145 domain-containing protein [Serratia ureilytica]MDU2603340.1 DUF4145 domain-containing protein [Serratia marcescens]MBH2801503.1 DUF4145 domain-containing protein [Serratia ureilytica]MBH2821220.1 DUF4145 domain-containing protein [Serratia ureilytica]MBH2965218.1 DUF4145 domain-containing protein [Serratia ureilytica]MDU2744142.1 DUF4145 domain-containing protein [Serratia marcescens]
MANLVFDCPRCGVKRVTFAVRGIILDRSTENDYDSYDYFCECGVCYSAVVLNVHRNLDMLSQRMSKDEILKEKGMVDHFVTVKGYSTFIDYTYKRPPEFLPQEINDAFIEGAKCMSIGCYNAAATMFRLCLDFATKELLPKNDDDGLNQKIRRSLGFRMEWLFKRNILPESLKELAECVKDDGNDGAHQGILDQTAALDLQDFAETLLERLYTEKERLRLAKARRAERHKK